VLALIPKLNNLSNVNEAILRATASVMQDTQAMLTSASRCQVYTRASCLVVWCCVARLTPCYQVHYNDALGQGTLSAKRTFYHKTYQRTRGIIAQVEIVGDSIAWLADSCAMATEGSDDVEKVGCDSLS
jgi:hypothetical protein